MQTVGEEHTCDHPHDSLPPHGDDIGTRQDGERLEAFTERPSPTRKSRIALPIGLGALTLGGCIAVAASNPGDDGAPLCWSRAVFGVDCPFCGGLRATNSLLRGDVTAALDHNVMLAVAMPVAVLMWVWWTWNSWRGNEISGPSSAQTPTWISVAAGVLLVAFGVVRNFTGTGWMRWLYSDTFVG